MADTIRERASLTALLADNISGNITPQSVRDVLASHPLWDSNSNVLLSPASGTGIKIGLSGASAVFGWKDLLGVVQTRGTGGTVPAFNSYINNIYQYQLTNSPSVHELYFEYHIPHDYVPGTDLFIHSHWSQKTAGSGTATWTFDLAYSKGYAQGAFSAATASVTVSTSANPIRFTHIISEVQFTSATASASRIDRALIQVDGIVLARVRCTSLPTPSPFVHYVDIHYQSTQLATKNRNAPFYT